MRYARIEFGDYHRDNPEILHELITLIRDGQSRGLRRWGMRSLLQVVALHQFRTGHRYHPQPDSYWREYSALIATYPDLVGFVATRKHKQVSHV